MEKFLMLMPLALLRVHSCGCETQQNNLPDLPLEHLERYLNTFTKVKHQCEENEYCRSNYYEIATSHNKSCWGYEADCSENDRFQTPSCPGEHSGWIRNKDDQVNTFYKQADFGYIQQQIEELMLMCEPKRITDSSLECTKYLRFCRGRYLMLDFRDLAQRNERIRYHMDVLGPGQIKGHCQLNETKLKNEMDHMGALQSWSPELRSFQQAVKPFNDENEECDMLINTPTFLMKIDASYNMYHHFCDFFNLYATLFVNQTHYTSFDTNTQIIVWETYPYDSPFADTFKAFSRNPVWTLDQVKGKRICFRNVVLPLLPRMIFGLYYNTPIIQGCHSSGLFRAFSEFVLHRLRVPFEAPQQKIRITFLSRRTKYRRVLNEDKLLEEINKNENLNVNKISYESISPHLWLASSGRNFCNNIKYILQKFLPETNQRDLSFIQQLEITRNTDVLIGMHGAGLTHLLFLPNWATIFELYNCEDPNCYKDLARLRGVNYITWEHRDLVYPEDEGHHPEGGAHAKFTNYAFNAKEFSRLVHNAAEHVFNHKDFQSYQKESTHRDEL